MLNPNVGEISSISSPLNFFKIVVLPALSSPLNSSQVSCQKVSKCAHQTQLIQGYSINMRTSRSLCFIFLKIVNKPILSCCQI